MSSSSPRGALSRRAARQRSSPIPSWSGLIWVAAPPREGGAGMLTEKTPPEPLLDIRALCAGYGDTDVLRGVDLKVEPGEIVAVLGSNGVGKSTLNRTISGVVRARRGAVVFAGAAIEQEEPG